MKYSLLLLMIQGTLFCHMLGMAGFYLDTVPFWGLSMLNGFMVAVYGILVRFDK